MGGLGSIARLGRGANGVVSGPDMLAAGTGAGAPGGTPRRENLLHGQMGILGIHGVALAGCGDARSVAKSDGGSTGAGARVERGSGDANFGGTWPRARAAVAGGD